MRLTCLGLALLLIAIVSPAHAELLQAKRASVMCTSAGALAKLGLPRGGSRDIGDHVPPEIEKIARDGGCTDFPAGLVVIQKTKRKNTSIVDSDSLTGDGVMTEVVVANIDFDPYVPPHDVFYDTIRAQCPNLLDDIAAESPSGNAFIESLPPPLRTSIEKALDDSCGPLGNCLIANRPIEIDRRHLTARWAAYLCAHPSTSIEQFDKSSASAHD